MEDTPYITQIASGSLLYHFVGTTHVRSIAAVMIERGECSQVLNDAVSSGGLFMFLRNPLDPTSTVADVMRSLSSGRASDVGGAVGFIADG